MVRKAGLGKGLDSLLPGGDTSPTTASGAVLIPTSQVIPNPRQPRLLMKEEDLQDLAKSIQEHGIIQPLIVTQDSQNNQYVLIAGERRLRAAMIAGLEMVPALVRQATERDMLELALIENVQRADLSPMETAEAYRHLNEEFGLSHEEIASRVGKNRVSVTNTLRLLKLPEQVQTAINNGQISEGHARALLGLNSSQSQLAALQTIILHDLNVRQTEELVRKLSGERPPSAPAKEVIPEIKALEDRLRSTLGTRVTLRHGQKGGTLTIHYYSNEELDFIIDHLTKE